MRLIQRQMAVLIKFTGNENRAEKTRCSEPIAFGLRVILRRQNLFYSLSESRVDRSEHSPNSVWQPIDQWVGGRSPSKHA